MTISDSAMRVGMTIGAASRQLSAFRSAGLVSAYRAGRSVLHVRTQLAADCWPRHLRRVIAAQFPDRRVDASEHAAAVVCRPTASTRRLIQVAGLDQIGILR
jgi:DNA-binding transcriptional ArsR family regulator